LLAGSTIAHRAIPWYPLEQDSLRTSPGEGSPVSDRAFLALLETLLALMGLQFLLVSR